MALICHTHKFVFIHVFKTGGTAIRTALAKYECEEILGAHCTADDVKKEMGEDWNNYYKFAFIRHPLDWMLSLYHYILAASNHFLYQETALLEFNDWIEFYIEYSRINPMNSIHGKNKTVSQNEFLTDMDFVGKQETLEEDFNKVREKLGLEIEPLEKVNVVMNQNGDNFRNLYNEKGKLLMLKHYAKDFIPYL